MLVTIVIILLVLALIGGLPSMTWNSGRNWGYAPSGGLGLIVVVLVILLLLGRI